jgi:hypothetical protein
MLAIILIAAGANAVARVRSAISAIVWALSRKFRLINGMPDGPDTWYEFSLKEDADKSFSIHTSRLTRERRLIPEICRELGLVAFDGQVYTLIGL